MSVRALDGVLERMAALDGMRGCALVDLDTGMACRAQGGEQVQVLCEAASDYWRMALRGQAHYGKAIGDLRAQAVIHAQGRLTLVACGRSMLLVCLSDEPDRVPWGRWKPMTREIQELVASF